MATKKPAPATKYLQRKADGVIFPWNANIAKRPDRMKLFRVITDIEKAKAFVPEDTEDNDGAKSVFDGIGKGFEDVVEEAEKQPEYSLTTEPRKLNQAQLKDFAAQLGIDATDLTRGQLIKAIIEAQAEAIHDKIAEAKPDISGDM